MLGVDKRAGAADFLHFGNDLKRKRGLARRFRAIDFYNTTTWQSTYAQRNIKPERTGGDDLDVVRNFVIAVAHNGTFTELLFDLRECCAECLGAVGACG